MHEVLKTSPYRTPSPPAPSNAFTEAHTAALQTRDAVRKARATAFQALFKRAAESGIVDDHTRCRHGANYREGSLDQVASHLYHSAEGAYVEVGRSFGTDAEHGHNGDEVYIKIALTIDTEGKHHFTFGLPREDDVYSDKGTEMEAFRKAIQRAAAKAVGY